jgi:hypothetical protein
MHTGTLDIRHVFRDSKGGVLHKNTGVAVQLVSNTDKQKQTVVCQGANARVGMQHAKVASELLVSTKLLDTVLLTLEVPNPPMLEVQCDW